MSIKQEHLDYLKEKGKFTVDCSQAIFSCVYIEIQGKYGHWFMALIPGELEPITELQKEFILVSRGQKSPFSIEELAWFKYLSRKAIEAKSGDKLYEQHHLQDDAFFSWEMEKKQKKMMFGVMRKNHRL